MHGTRSPHMLTPRPAHRAGYQHRLPYTGVEVACIWAINSWIRTHEVNRLKGKPFFAGCVDA